MDFHSLLFRVMLRHSILNAYSAYVVPSLILPWAHSPSRVSSGGSPWFLKAHFTTLLSRNHSCLQGLHPFRSLQCISPLSQWCSVANQGELSKRNKDPRSANSFNGFPIACSAECSSGFINSDHLCCSILVGSILQLPRLCK